MNVKKLVCVRDAKTEVFGQPIMVQNLAEAERLYSDFSSDRDSLVGKHPEDFALWCIGSYDVLTGEIRCEAPFVVCGGKNE